MASAPLLRVQTLDGKQSLIPEEALGVTDPADGLRKTIGVALGGRLTQAQLAAAIQAIAPSLPTSPPAGVGLWLNDGALTYKAS